MKVRNFGFALSAVATALVLSGCGGGGDGGGASFPIIPASGTPTTPAATSATVTGTAATGAPISGGMVSLTCANGKGATTTTGADGKWSATFSGAVFPCVVTVSGGSLPAGQKLHSIVTAEGYVNVTPLTELILAHAFAAATSGTESLDAAGMAALAAKIDAARTDIMNLLADSGYTAPAEDPFSTQFQTVSGDAYDDLLEQLAQSFADAGTTLDGIVAAILASNDDDGFDLPITHTLKSADLAAQPQLNKAHLSSSAGVLSMKLDAGSNAVGSFVGGGAGNKAVLQMSGLAGTKLKDISKIELEMKGDAGGLLGPVDQKTWPYAYLNFTVDLTCNAAPLAANASLADVQARRRIVIFDPFYNFIQQNQSSLSTTEFKTIPITQGTPGWRLSAGAPVGSVAVGGKYNGSETLAGFDYTTYPDACIVDGITGDGGMFRNTAQPNCLSNASLPGTAPATCGAPYSGAILVLGDSGTTRASEWSVKRVKVEAKRQQTFRFE